MSYKHTLSTSKIVFSRASWQETPSTAYTLWLWLRPTAHLAGEAFCQKPYDNGDTAPYISYGLEFGGVAARSVLGDTANGIYFSGSTSNFPLTLDTWQYFYGTYNGTTLAVNCNAVTASDTVSGKTIKYDTSANGPLRVSVSSSGDDFYVAEAACWSSALSADDLTLLKNGRYPDEVSNSTLVWYCPLLNDLKAYDKDGVELATGTGTDVASDALHPTMNSGESGTVFVPRITRGAFLGIFNRVGGKTA